MKSRSLTALLFLSFSLNALEITTTERVDIMAQPDVLFASFGYELNSKDLTHIKLEFNKILKNIKQDQAASKNCKQKNYSILPRYVYQNGTQIDDGYGALVNFECQFSDIEPYNTLKSGLDATLSKDVRKFQNALSWSVSEAQMLSQKDKLRAKIIEVAKEQSRKFSTELDMKCELQSISYNSLSDNIIPMSRAMMSSEVEAPLNQTQNITMDANIKYSCAP